MVDYLPLLKAVEELLAKAQIDLAEFLETAGYKNPSELAETTEAVQDVLEIALSEYQDRIENALTDITDPEELLIEWKRVIEDEALKQSISDSVASVLFACLIPHLDEYIKFDDPELSARSVSEKAVGRILELADIVAESKVNGMNRYIGSAIEKLCEQQVEKAASTHEPLEKVSLRSLIQSILDSPILERILNCLNSALTAVVSYQSIVQQEAISQNPAVIRKIWHHCKDPGITPRPNHLDMDEVEADADGFFTLIGADGTVYSIEYPRDLMLPPSETINCHCTVSTGIDDEIMALALETREQLQEEAIDELNDRYEQEAQPGILERAKRWIERLFSGE